MTPSQLKFEYENRHPEGFFFSRSTMKFFGDTMRNYGVRTTPALHKGVLCWELYRKKPVKHGLQTSHFFSQTDFSQV